MDQMESNPFTNRKVRAVGWNIEFEADIEGWRNDFALISTESTWRGRGRDGWASFCALPRRCDVRFTYSGSVTDVSRKKDLERLRFLRRTIPAIVVRLKYHFLCLPRCKVNNSAASALLKTLANNIFPRVCQSTFFSPICCAYASK